MSFIAVTTVSTLDPPPRFVGRLPHDLMGAAFTVNAFIESLQEPERIKHEEVYLSMRRIVRAQWHRCRW